MYNAEDVVNGQHRGWSEDWKVIRDQWGNNVPNNGLITGSLANYQSAKWHLDLLPYVH